MKNTLSVKKPVLHLRLPLQYFSSTHPFAAEPVESTPHPLAAEATPSQFAMHTDYPNPLDDMGAEGGASELQVETQGQASEELPGDGTAAPTTAEEQIAKLNFGGREVDVTDPVMHDLHKDYTELNKTFQQTNQEKIQFAQEKEQLALETQQLKSQLEAFQSQQQQQVQEQSTEMSPERRQEISERYNELAYEDKLKADEWYENLPEIKAAREQKLEAMVQARVNEQLAPIAEREKQAQANEVIRNQMFQLSETHSDFQETVPAIQDLLAQQPELGNLPNAMETMYWMVKGQAAQAQAAPPTPEQLLADPSFQQQILADETIKGQFLQQYKQTLTQQNQQIPNMMGSGVGTQTPMSQGNRAPRNLREASEAARRELGDF